MNHYHPQYLYTLNLKCSFHKSLTWHNDNEEESYSVKFDVVVMQFYKVSAILEKTKSNVLKTIKYVYKLRKIFPFVL